MVEYIPQSTNAISVNPPEMVKPKIRLDVHGSGDPPNFA